MSIPIVETLTRIFCDVFDRDDIVLTREMTAADIEGWDSFNNINLMVASEIAFGIKFQTAEVEHLENVGALIDAISAKLGRN